MNILVTGGSSTIGKHLQQIIPNATYLNSQHCDLRDGVVTNAVLNYFKPDVVIHLAAVVGGIQDNIARPVQYLQDNLLMNTNIIKESYNAGVKKLIAISSTCIYPDVVSEYPMKEDVVFSGPPTPTNEQYAYSKRCMISLIEAYNKQYNTQYCYITPSNLYSELDSHQKEKAHYITALLHKIKEAELAGTKSIKLLGTGRPLRQFTYAEDVAKILEQMITNNVYESFNVSNPETYSIHELAALTLNALDKTDWSIAYSHPELDGQYRKDVSIEKLLKLFPDFNFTPFVIGIKKVYSLL